LKIVNIKEGGRITNSKSDTISQKSDNQEEDSENASQESNDSALLSQSKLLKEVSARKKQAMTQVFNTRPV